MIDESKKIDLGDFELEDEDLEGASGGKKPSVICELCNRHFPNNTEYIAHRRTCKG